MENKELISTSVEKYFCEKLASKRFKPMSDETVDKTHVHEHGYSRR